MASIFQTTRPESYEISPESDVFIRLDNGKALRLQVHENGVSFPLEDRNRVQLNPGIQITVIARGVVNQSR